MRNLTINLKNRRRIVITADGGWYSEHAVSGLGWLLDEDASDFGGLSQGEMAAEMRQALTVLTEAAQSLGVVPGG